jgi:hypothetical protein
MKKDLKKAPREELRRAIKPKYLRASYYSNVLAVNGGYKMADDDDYFFEVEDY